LMVSATFLVVGAFLLSATGDCGAPVCESVAGADLLSASGVPTVSSEKEVLSSLLRDAESRTRARIPPTSPLWEDYRQAKRDLRNKDVEAAKEALGGVIASATEFAPAYYYLGLMAAGGRRFEEAENYYKTALGVDPGFTLVRANLGNLYYRRCRFPEAAVEYERVLKAVPDFAEVHRRLAEAYSEDRSRFGDAARHFRRYLELVKEPIDRTAVEKRVIELEVSGMRNAQ